MSELLSRVVLSTESIVFCFPLTVWLFAQRMPAQFHALIDSSSLAVLTNMAAGIFLAAMLACLWRLIAAFVIGGRGALQRVAAYWWVTPTAGAALTGATCVRWWVMGNAASSGLGAFAWGIPLLLPVVHLCLERWLRPRGDRANASVTASSSAEQPRGCRPRCHDRQQVGAPSTILNAVRAYRIEAAVVPGTVTPGLRATRVARLRVGATLDDGVSRNLRLPRRTLQLSNVNPRHPVLATRRNAGRAAGARRHADDRADMPDAKAGRCRARDSTVCCARH